MAFPGWAFDHRVFLEKKWEYDLIVCDLKMPRVDEATTRTLEFERGMLDYVALGGEAARRRFRARDHRQSRSRPRPTARNVPRRMGAGGKGEASMMRTEDARHQENLSRFRQP